MPEIKEKSPSPEAGDYTIDSETSSLISAAIAKKKGGGCRSKVKA